MQHSLNVKQYVQFCNELKKVTKINHTLITNILIMVMQTVVRDSLRYVFITVLIVQSLIY